MVTMLVDKSTATRAEVFHVPQDYPLVETEDGSVLGHGWYWWGLQDSGAPDTYPSGPFESRVDAMEDWSMAGAWQPTDNED